MKSKKKIIRMENLRRVVQVMVLSVFLYLFALTIGSYDAASQNLALRSKMPVDLFFRINPLLALTTMVSTRHIISTFLIYALPVLILSVVAGRFFCGWICPLGTTLDATDALFFKKKRSKQPVNKHARNIKYYILAAIVIAAIFGMQVAYFLDPITIITRAFTLAVFPVTQIAVRSLGGVNFVSDKMPFLANNPYIPSDVQYFYRLNFLAAIVFIAILALNSVFRRFWCRNLCPLGALLGFVSRFSIVRRIVKSECIKCSKCIPDCKMGAISEDPAQYQASECIYCYSCTSECPALSTKIAPSLKSDGYNGELDLNRRRLFQAAGMGIAVAALGKTNIASKTSRNGYTKTSNAFLIRPPGSLPEDEFIDSCVRCSECMKVCPTNGLQPALAEAGIEGLWTPVLVPRIGECSQNCNLCSKVCPSHAIQPFEVEEKPHIYIGQASIDRSQCIAWNSDKECLVCDEHCSYHALHWKEIDGNRRPFVNGNKCVGCGICENACPIQPVAAIRVFSFGDKRHMSRDSQKAFFQQTGNGNDGIG